jgi:hypothetical protein
MPGVGEQGHGIAEEAIDGFDHDEGDVQSDADGEGESETGRRVNMAVAMSMSRTSSRVVMRGMIVTRVIVVMRGVTLLVMPVRFVIVAASFAVHRSRLFRDKDRPRRAEWIKGEMNRQARF